MQSDAPTTPSPSFGATGVVEDMIRVAVNTGFPVSRLLTIARDRLREHPDPEAQWELAALEGEAAKPVIEARSGPSFSTEEVAANLKKTGQTVRNMVERLEIVAYPEILGRGWRFPMWQFSHGVVAQWVPDLLKAYGHNGWGVVDFLTVPRLTPDGSYTYLERLKDRQVAVVLAAARRSNPD